MTTANRQAARDLCFARPSPVAILHKCAYQSEGPTSCAGSCAKGFQWKKSPLLRQAIVQITINATPSATESSAINRGPVQKLSWRFCRASSSEGVMAEGLSQPWQFVDWCWLDYGCGLSICAFCRTIALSGLPLKSRTVAKLTNASTKNGSPSQARRSSVSARSRWFCCASNSAKL